MVLRQGVLGSIIEVHRKILKLLLQNHLAQMLEIWYVALPSGPLFFFSNEGPRVQDGVKINISLHIKYSMFIVNNG